MKKRFFSAFFVFLIFAAGSIAQSKDEKAVAAAVEVFRKGIVDADRNALEMITADELVYGHSNGKVQNKKEFIEEIVSNNPFDYVTVDLSDQTIRMAGKNAVVRHTFSAETKSPNGTAGKIFIGNTLVWVKQHGKWKLLARQAYKK